MHLNVLQQKHRRNKRPISKFHIKNRNKSFTCDINHKIQKVYNILEDLLANYRGNNEHIDNIHFDESFRVKNKNEKFNFRTLTLVLIYYIR